MIRGLLTFLFVLGAALGQAWLGPVRMLGEVRPPLLLGVVVYFALNRSLACGLAIAFAAGTIQDLLSLAPPGFSTVLFGIAAAVVSRFKGLVLAESAVTGVFFGGGTVLLVWLAFGLLLAQAGVLGLSAGAIAVKVCGTAALGAVTTPLIFVVAAAAYRGISLDERREDAHAVH